MAGAKSVDLILYKDHPKYSCNHVLNQFINLRHEPAEMSASSIEEIFEDNEKKISNLINHELELIGVTSKLKGRQYIHDAILYLIQNENSDLSPIQYLTKPINESQLKETLLRAIQLNQKKYILFKSYDCQLPIELKSILLIETCYDEICVKTRDKIYRGSKRSNYDCLKILTSLSFYKLDRSRIINFNHIKNINNSWITMSNDEMIEIPKMRRTSFKKNYFLFLENI